MSDLLFLLGAVAAGRLARAADDVAGAMDDAEARARQAVSSGKAMSLDDPRIPWVTRQAGLAFRPPARFVVDLGHEEYALCGKDGELLDVVWQE